MRDGVPAEYAVRRPDQLEALASPVRYELAECLSALAPASIAQIARAIGRKPQTLYPHVRRLLEVGLVREAGKRHTGRRLETLYETPGRQFRFTFDPEDPANRRTIAAAVSASLRRSSREFAALLEAGEPRTRGPERDTRWMRRTGWVTVEDLGELHQHVDAIARIFERARTPRLDAHLQALTITTYPAPSAPAEADADGDADGQELGDGELGAEADGSPDDAA